MEKKYVMAIDQGTTGTRVILFNRNGGVHSTAYHEIRQIYPQPGWVEHDPREYWDTVLQCTKEVLEQGNAKAEEIETIGITNQRETTILWDKITGEPYYNAIVWQCRRTASYCEDLKKRGFETLVREQTGLVIDAYFSGTKIKWILDNVPGIMDRVKEHRVCMGTIDSWLMWKLSDGAYHVTDFSNASRTMLLNVHDLAWDQRLLDMLDIPRSILPELKPTSGIMAMTAPKVFFGQEIPIAGVAGDQHAATFGQTCFEKGMAKNTYGTALALMMNIGDKFVPSEAGLTTDLLWHVNKKTSYGFEGVIFIGGAVVQWLRDGLKIIQSAPECDRLAEKVPDTGDVYLVPGFTGLCAPYWDMYARGLIIGITRGTTQEHLARAALESMAYQTKDVMDAMIKDSKVTPATLRVDGGASKSNFLMQFQADILGIPVERPMVSEMAARGAAYLAGLGTGFWKDMKELSSHWKRETLFEPKIGIDQREELYAGWQEAVKRSLQWDNRSGKRK
ncbi:MAG: glycerol kinase GlpK [Sphaerochaetaceae bacterium]|nr:glycerol kinase GlpK [Sphaerochaetaceae bacterium]